MSQITIFFICAACGIVSGVFYDFLYAVRTAARVLAPARRKLLWVVTFACDVIYFCILAVIFLVASHIFSFYELRAYMIASLALGALMRLL